MFKNSFLITALGTAMLAPIVYAQENKDAGQQAGQGIGYALTTQERCAGRPLRSTEADKALQARIVNSISKHTGSTPDNVRLGLAAGAMQANFTPKPTNKDCKEAEKLVGVAQKM
jgi:hypothetical protein